MDVNSGKVDTWIVHYNTLLPAVALLPDSIIIKLHVQVGIHAGHNSVVPSNSNTAFKSVLQGHYVITCHLEVSH